MSLEAPALAASKDDRQRRRLLCATGPERDAASSTYLAVTCLHGCRRPWRTMDARRLRQAARAARGRLV